MSYVIVRNSHWMAYGTSIDARTGIVRTIDEHECLYIWNSKENPNLTLEEFAINNMGLDFDFDFNELYNCLIVNGHKVWTADDPMLQKTLRELTGNKRKLRIQKVCGGAYKEHATGEEDFWFEDLNSLTPINPDDYYAVDENDLPF